MKHSVQLHSLAPTLVGKTIKDISLTPLIWEGDVGLRKCRVHFGDGAVVELQSCDLDQTLEYLSEGIEHDDAYEIDAKSSEALAGLVVEGIVVAQTFFSFGLLVSERRVICLDFTNGQSGVYLTLCIRLMSDLMDETLQVIGQPQGTGVVGAA